MNEQIQIAHEQPLSCAPSRCAVADLFAITDSFCKSGRWPPLAAPLEQGQKSDSASRPTNQ
jgi:hypothetical protein